MIVTKRAFLLALASMSVACLEGCVPLVLYGPRTYHDAETAAVVAPFESVSVECNSNAMISISLGDSDPEKLKHLRVVSSIMKTDDGEETRLRLHSAILENPNSFRMDFGKADYLGNELYFRISLASESKSIEVTFQTRIESRVYWPKDSDYSG